MISGSSEVELGGVAFLWVIAIGALSGGLSFLAFRRWSDAVQIRAAGNAMVAHLMEFRLFPGEPALILRAQRDLLSANAQLLRAILRPTLLLTLPFSLLWAVTGAFFARAPLRIGEPAVVTAQYRGSLPDVQLIPPTGFEIETPAVRVRKDNQLSWRIRPRRESSGSLRLRWESRLLEKTVSAQTGPRWISEQRSGSILGYLADPLELPFSDRTIAWVRIQYPAATVFGYNWLMWFSLAACGAALLSTLGGLRR